MVLLLDFHPYFDEPVHLRLIKEIAQDYEFRHQKLIFISHAVSLPDELKSFAAAFELALPTTIELSRMVAEEAEVWAMRGDNNKVRAAKASVTALVNNLGGLTRTDARRLIRNASSGRQCLAARATGGHATAVERHGRAVRGAARVGGGAYRGG